MDDKRFQLKNNIRDGTVVSTVLIPVEFGGGPYETALFKANGDTETVDSYVTEAEARAGHERWVAKAREDAKNGN